MNRCAALAIFIATQSAPALALDEREMRRDEASDVDEPVGEEARHREERSDVAIHG